MPELFKEKAVCKEAPASDMESSYAPSMSFPPSKRKWMFFSGISRFLKKKSNQELLKSNSQCNEAVLPDVGRTLSGDNISTTLTSFASESTDTRSGAMTSVPVDPHGHSHDIV